MKRILGVLVSFAMLSSFSTQAESLSLDNAVSVAQHVVASLGTISNQDIITWGSENWITKFADETTFRGSDLVTREQAAKMVYSLLGSHERIIPEYRKLIDAGQSACKFVDESAIDTDLTAGANAMCALGIMKGYKGSFMPKGTISANDIAVIVGRVEALFPEISSYIPKVKLADSYSLTRMDLLRGLYAVDSTLNTLAAQKTQADLDMAKSLWHSNAIGKTYSLTRKISCFCPDTYTRPISYKVVSGSVDTGTAVYVDLSGGKVPSEQTESLQTVDQAFALIQSAIDNGAYLVSVEYDTTYGYPKSIYIDQHKQMVDEEKSYTFSLEK